MSTRIRRTSTSQFIEVRAERLDGAPVGELRRWSDDFRDRAIAAPLEPDTNISALARLLAITPSQLFAWCRAAFRAEKIERQAPGEPRAAKTRRVEIEIGGAVERASADISEAELRRIGGGRADVGVHGHHASDLQDEWRRPFPISEEDTIYGNGGADNLIGLGGAKTIYGGNGNDTLNGGAGSALIDGGNGADAAIYSSSALATTFGLNGNDLIVMSAGDGADILRGVERTIFDDGAFNPVIGNESNNSGLTGGSSADLILGFGGNDRLTGKNGADALFGGAGADRFAYSATSDSGAANRDMILDFTNDTGPVGSRDIIDISGIDANTSATGNNAFGFNGNSPAAYSVWIGALNGNTSIYGDVNGDFTADFAIQLAGVKNISASDFVL